MKQPMICILIDDDPDDQELFVTAVKDVASTTTCQVISDARQALEVLRRSSRLPDLIFLDINMPKMDGFEFIVHLKREDKLRQIPVIFYSTTRDEKQIEMASKLGASAFITKANNYKSLCSMLQHFLRPESGDDVHKFVFTSD